MAQNKLTKQDFIESIYKDIYESNSDITKEQIKVIVQKFLDTLAEALSEGSQVEFRGLGVFEFRYRQPKTNAHNPKTGKKVQVSGHTVVSFRSGQKIKDKVWKLPPI